MKPCVLILAFLSIIGCSTTRHYSAMRVVRQVDADLGRERNAAGFEHRLDQLGARIVTGANPSDERVASFPAPATTGKPVPTQRPLPGYFPPRMVTIVYTVTIDGVVELQSAEVVSLGNRLAKDG